MAPDPTTLLKASRTSEDAEARELLPLIYQELHRIAKAQRSRERNDLTLSTTGLVHEAYLKLFDQTQAEWRDQRHFVALASRAIRRILVDYARSRNRQKRRGKAVHVSLNDEIVGTHDTPEYVLALEEALNALENYDPNLARIVELRYFGGLTMKDTAAELDQALRTVERSWTRARAFLLAHMTGVFDQQA